MLFSKELSKSDSWCRNKEIDENLKKLVVTYRLAIQAINSFKKGIYPGNLVQLKPI